MSEQAFDGIADFYDLVYAGKDTEAEASYVAALLTRHGVAPPSRILEWGSGTGRHARALARLGYQMTGLERSAEMLHQAQAAVTDDCDVRFLHGDLLEPSPGADYDGLIACFHVISYLTDEPALARAFANARQALRPRGVFLFDVWHGPAVVAQGPQTRSVRFADAQRELVRIAEPRHDPEKQLVDVQYRYFHRRHDDALWALAEETHRLRYWFGSEIRRHAEQAGLRWLAAEEWLSGRTPGCETWGVCHLLGR
ncbi:MAG: class I SAM-dependent methyltransferase [Pseudomonadota bacterium]